MNSIGKLDTSISAPFATPGISTPGNPDAKKSADRDLPAELLESYQEIGKMLRVCEAANTGIGIPWVPPTARALALRTGYFSPLRDFVRSSLVGVPTATLESYAEDIQELEPNEESARLLGIAGLALFERYALCVLLFAVSFSMFVVSAIWVHAGGRFAMSFGLGVAVLVTIVSAYVCSERSRRATFHWLIVEELLRRKGLDQDDSATVSIYSLPAAKSEAEPA